MLATAPLLDEVEPERDGIPPTDACWRVPWIVEVGVMPADAVWPRLMTVPHPDAVGSLGGEFVAWSNERSGGELRWWQRLVAARVLEVDADGRLVWEAALVTTARQVGKSYLLRELCLWRIHQGDRFDEPQDVLHTGKDLAVCKEVQRPARVWAKARADRFKVREVNGQEEIEHLADGSRWMLRAKEAVYGYAASMGVVDEAWKVRVASVDEGLTPTMVEREQSQLLLVSTAHRRATALMLDRRAMALDQLDTGTGDLLVEWSAPESCELDDEAGWRLASPHWGGRRRRLIERAYEKTLVVGSASDDPDEPDPRESFTAQWLNRWPRVLDDSDGPVVPLLTAGVWAGLLTPVPPAGGSVWVAIEDGVGLSAAVACARRLDDGRLELDGWTRPGWDDALADVLRLVDAYPVRRVLVGASLLDRVPPALAMLCDARGARQTRSGLATLRDLAGTASVVHDQAGALDEAFGHAMVRESQGGLVLQGRGATHLVRAAVWALAAADKPAAVPAIH